MKNLKIWPNGCINQKYKYPIMKKYRIILKDILCDGMDETEAREALQMFQSTTPDKKYEIEEYKLNPVANRMGRDPDLH